MNIDNLKQLTKLKSVQMSVIFILTFFTLSCWALASPVGSTPDEDFHLTSIWCASGGVEGICEPNGTDDTMLVSKSLLESQCFAHHREISAGCQLQNEIFSSPEMVNSNRGNFGSGYPPVYYASMHLFAGQNIEQSVLAMRIFNSFLFCVLSGILWVSISQKLRATLRVMWLVVLVPLGLFLIPSVNPSSWAIMGIGFGAISLTAYLQKDQSRKSVITNASIFVLSSVMAAGTRADGAAFVGLLIVLVGIATYKSWKTSKAKLLLPLLMIPVSILFFLSGSQSHVASTGFGENIFQDRTPFSVLAVNLLTLPDLLVGVFGTWGLGWLDTPMPQTVWALAAGAFVATIVISWQFISKRRLFVTLLLISVLIAIPLYVLQKSLAHVGELLQPRYLLPLILLLPFFSLQSYKEGKFESTILIKLSIFLSLIGAQCIAIYVNIDRYVHGASIKTGVNLDSGMEWWWDFPVSPMATFIIATLSFSILAWLLLEPLGKQKPTLRAVNGRGLMHSS